MNSSNRYSDYESYIDYIFAKTKSLRLYKSFSFWSVASMALSSACVVDIVALKATPIIGSWDVIFSSHYTFRSLYACWLWLGFIAAFASVTKIEIQKGTFNTIPFSVFLFPFDTAWAPVVSITRTWTRSIPFLFLFISLFISVDEYSL